MQVYLRNTLVLLSLVSFCSVLFPSSNEGKNNPILRKTVSSIEVSRNENPTTYERLNVPTVADQLKPLQVVNQYKAWHGVNALEWDGTNPERKFALAIYWCPDRAGNIFHSLYNTMAWAIITNRTLLLDWDDSNPTNNLPSECASILKEKSWIPSYSEWRNRLNHNHNNNNTFLAEQPVSLSMDVMRWNYDATIRFVVFPMIPDLWHLRTNLNRNGWADHPTELPNYASYLLALPAAQKRVAESLYALGPEFMFGMFFRNLFDVQIKPNPQHDNDIYKGVFSLALHSRHIAEADDGSFVPDEIACLTRLLPEKTSPETCRVYLLSDRTTTIRKLQTWLEQERNCSAFSAVHDSVNGSLSSSSSPRPRVIEEHGPFPGIGFFQDLFMGAQARSAVIGDIHRSSFGLLHELIAYDRMVEFSRATIAAKRSLFPVRPPDLHKLELCTLPDKRAKGYNYGEGTPTFIRRNFQRLFPLLEPHALWQAYRKEHSRTALQKERNGTTIVGRRFVVMRVDLCGTATAENRQERTVSGLLYIDDGPYRPLLQGIAWAILTNRTLLVQQDNDEASSCPGHESLRLQSWIPQWKDWSRKLDLAQPSTVLTADLAEDDPVVAFVPADSLVPWSKLEHNALAPRPIRERHEELVEKYGLNFLNGMLWFDLFQAPHSEKTLQGAPTETAWHILLQEPDNKISKTSKDIVATTGLSKQSTVALEVDLPSLANADQRERLSTCLSRVLGNVTLAAGTRDQEQNASTATSRVGSSTKPSLSVPSCHVILATGTRSSPDGKQNGDLQQDRDDWVETLRQMVQNFNCTLQSQDPASGKEPAMVKVALERARAGWVGRNPSVLLERIEFQRHEEARLIGRFPIIVPPFATCDLSYER